MALAGALVAKLKRAPTVGTNHYLDECGVRASGRTAERASRRNNAIRQREW